MSYWSERAAALAARDVSRRPPLPVPQRRPAPPPVHASQPSPIKLGYYCDPETGQIGEPNLYHGERHVLLLGLNGAGKSTRELIELLMTSVGRSIVVLDIKGELAAQTAAGLFNALYLPKEVSPKCNIRRLLCILPQDRGFPAVRMSECMRGNRSARRLPWDRSIHCSAC
jgi:hypothetical protein